MSFYVLGQLLPPIAILTILLTSVIWLISVLPLMDLVVNRGQSAPTFLYLTLLMLPTSLVMIMPMAFFVATLFTLQRMRGDSELLVMASAGYSVRQLAVPVLSCAVIVMVVTYACILVLAPAGERELRDKLVDIRADVAGALLNEGEFNPVSPGVTVFIRQLGSNGDIDGILVHDDRDRARPVTYIAEKGILAQTPAGPRLIMINGTIETSSQAGRHLQALHYESHTMNLEQFSGPARDTVRKMNERYLSELLWPSEPGVTARNRDQFFAEAHNRISQPLYCLAFAFLAMAAVVRGGATTLEHSSAVDSNLSCGIWPAHHSLWHCGCGAGQSVVSRGFILSPRTGRDGRHRRASGLHSCFADSASETVPNQRSGWLSCDTNLRAELKLQGLSLP